jgi:peptidoglycan hydrolase CwlO-like protein
MNHRPIRFAALAAAAAITLSAVSVGASGASSLSDNQAQAKALAAQIAAQGDKLDALNEQIHEAQIQLQQAQSNIAVEDQQIAATKKQSDKLRGILRSRAADMYMNSSDNLDVLEPGSLTDYSIRAKYTEAAAQHDNAAINQLTDVTDQLNQQQAQQRAAEKSAAQKSAQLNSLHASLVSQTAALQHKLATTNATILAIYNKQKADALAAQNAKLAAEVAAAKTQSHTNSSGNTGGGGNSRSTNVGQAPGYVPAPNPQAAIVVAFAVAQLGKPYVYAGAGPNVWDCSVVSRKARCSRRSRKRKPSRVTSSSSAAANTSACTSAAAS